MKAPFILLTAFTASVHGQTVIGNIFEGSNGSNPTSLTASVIVAGDTETGTVGPGWAGSVTLPAGVVYSLTMSINEGGNGEFSVAGGGVAGVAGTFSASKTFGAGVLGTPFEEGELYALDLQVDSVATLSLLGSYTVGLAIDGTGVDNSAGTGLLGVADLLGLFGSNTTATLLFRAPDTINTQNLTVTLAGGSLAGLLGNEVTFTSGTVYAVPEPGVTAMAGVFALGLIARRRR